jgi:hypothetical protein
MKINLFYFYIVFIWQLSKRVMLCKFRYTPAIRMGWYRRTFVTAAPLTVES